MAPHRRWTQSDLTNLRGGLHNGETAAEVASRLQRSLEEVRSMMMRLRLRTIAAASGAGSGQG